MTAKAMESFKRRAAMWLRQGISPRRLALTLALGFAIGCIPVVGIPTVVCGALALAFGLNLPAIQAANYAAMPFQLALIVPFVKLGGRLFSAGSGRAIDAMALLHSSPSVVVSQMGWLTLQALLAWLMVAVPAVALLTATLTAVLRRVPAVAAGKVAK